MWIYSKKLQYPIAIKNKDLSMAKYIITQFGGPNGELAASTRYITQRYTMPDEKGKAFLYYAPRSELSLSAVSKDNIQKRAGSKTKGEPHERKG